jgi:hypothetical protein
VIAMNISSHFRTPSTAKSMADTLANVGRQKPLQTLFHITTFKINDVPISHVYLVVPAGEKQGDYWHVSETNLWRLKRGMTPQEIGCELADEDAPSSEYPDEDRACSAADRAYQFSKEQF